MMTLHFSPIRSDMPLHLTVEGTALIVNGARFDFSALVPGGSLPRESLAANWLASDVQCDAEGITLTVVLPHGPEAPSSALFPSPVVVTRDGPVPLPG